MSGRLLLLVATLTVAVGLTSMSSSAAARPPLLIGIQDDPVFVELPTAYEGRGAFSLISASAGYRWSRRLGAKVIRITVSWANVMPGASANEQEWSRYDNAIAEAHRHGFIVQLELAGPAPRFATADHRVGYDRPSAYAFGHFAAAAAARYSDIVSTYSIWNEPNWWFELQPKQDAPRLYRGLYEAGYAAIRRTQPKADVLIGELAPLGPPESGTPPLQFLRALTCRDRHMRVLRRCKPLHAEGFALHPYTLSWRPKFPGTSPDDVTTGSLPRLVRMLRALAHTHALSTPSGGPPPIYLTEYGWQTDYAPGGEQRRAQHAIEGYDLAYRRPQVREIVWYELAPPPASIKAFWDTALLTTKDQASATFDALRRWIEAMKAGKL